MAIESPKPVRDAGYYLREESLTTPTFRGNGAKLLGLLDKPIDHDTYLSLMEGHATDADGGRGEFLPKYAHPNRRMAFDITANNPKSVSIALEVGGDTRIVDVIAKSRLAVERYVEKHTRVKTTKKSAREKSAKPDNLVMIWFDHPASRQDDPHRHGHLVVLNLCKDGDIYKGIELRYLDKPRMAKLYSDTMRKGLNELGYKTRRAGKEFEIVGVPAEVKATFSRRHAAIKDKEVAYERKKGAPLTPKAKGKLSVYDRPEKVEKALEDRRAGWLSRITHAQYDGIRGLVKKAKAAVRWVQCGVESRAAFDRQRGIERDDHVIELERGRGR